MAYVSKSSLVGQGVELVTAITATASPEVTDAHKFRRHSFAISTTGTWVFHLQTSDDGGTTWVRATADLTIATSTDSIFWTDPVNQLRIVCTRTGGACTVWVRQNDMRARDW